MSTAYRAMDFIWTIDRDDLAKITHVTARSRCGTSEERVPLSRKHCITIFLFLAQAGQDASGQYGAARKSTDV